MRKIIYTMPDGGVAVTTPVRNTIGETLVLVSPAVPEVLEVIPATPEVLDVDGDVIVAAQPERTVIKTPRIEAVYREMTDEEIEQRAWAKLPPDAINPQFVDPSQIPADRTFRNAWKPDAGAVVVDMVKAVAIHKDRLREIRAPKLAALDSEYMKALEQNDTARMQIVAARKQALRDVTTDPSLTAAKTPDDLKAAIPEILK